MFIADKESDLILVTEVIPKAQVNPISPALLAISGYTMYTNFDPCTKNLGSCGIRGIAVFTCLSLHVSEVSLHQFGYKDHLWIEVSLSGSDKLLVGCLYRSPSCDGPQSISMLEGLLKHVGSAGYSHIVLAGDFNMPTIDWNLNLSSAPASHCSHAFIDMVQDCFLHQHVQQPTRYRLGEKPNTLDLIFSNEEGMVKNLEYYPGLGKSDHAIITFDVECYTHHTCAPVSCLNLHRADFDHLNSLVRLADWEEMIPKPVQERYNYWKKTVHDLTNRCIPPALPKAAKKNIYMTREALKLKRKKRSLWLAYLYSKDPIDHARYTRCRNDLRRLTRNLRRDFEMRLAKDAKQNSKPFWRYVHSRLKTRSRVEDLRQDDGSLATEDRDKAGVLNSFFCSIFTDENENVPAPSQVYSGPVLEDVAVTPQLVVQKLKMLRPSSSPGPDGIHPRVLVEVAQSIATSLSQLFHESLMSGELPTD